MGKPRIVHVYKDFWPPILGGVERCINWMVDGLREEFDFTILVNSRTRETREREWEGIRIVEVGEWGRALSAPLSPAFPRQMRKIQADIWHFHLPNPTGDVSWLLSRPKGKVVATYHSDIVRQAWAMRLYGPFLHAFLKRCDAIMPTSPRQMEHSAVLQRHKQRCHPVPLGIPLKGLERTPELGTKARGIKRKYKGSPLLVFVGRLRYYKGLHFMVSAMRGLPSVRFLIIGEGPEKENLQHLARELEVADRVEFLGELPDEEVVAHLSAADIFVMPSHLPGEQFGLSMVEAMALGVPAICCDLPTGVPFVNQDGVTGRVVPPGDDGALARAVGELLSDSNLRFKMGEAALRRAREEFSQQTMCDRLSAVYQAVLDERPVEP
ncbi:MAG: glycosyltransferase [Candidatus Sumerlaeia bacterium]|nr:glycosyltransferase [Candidatus Sumerlaeia bacterium]